MLELAVQTLTSLPPLMYVAIGLATLLYFRNRSRFPANIPPFPVKPYPILGHLPMLKKKGMAKTFEDWKESTGDIFSLALGSELMVILNSMEVIKEAFVKKADYFSDRPPSALLEEEQKTGVGHGIAFNSGPSWKEQRTVSLSILREFGMGKNWMAEKISEEVDVYLDLLAEFQGEANNVQILTNVSVSNVICAILIGNRFESDDPYFVKMIELINRHIRSLSQFSPVQAFPFLKHLPGDLFNQKLIRANRRILLDHFSAKFVKERDPGDQVNSRECFIHAYNKEMKDKIASGQSTTLNKTNLIRVVTNLFVAGSETTSTTLLWGMLFAIRYPECQEKINKEMEEKLGLNRRPTIQDRVNLPYTNAFILETQRVGSIAPFAIQHYCNTTTEVGGYTIPAGTKVLPNLMGVMHEPKVWKDPHVFRPERFLDADGKVVVPEEFVPFSIGRRLCLGESLARMELFLFLTGIFHRFQVLPEDPKNLPSLEPLASAVRAPFPFKVRFVEKSS